MEKDMTKEEKREAKLKEKEERLAEKEKSQKVREEQKARIAAEKEEIEDKNDDLLEERDEARHNKDKARAKELSKKINKLKNDRKRVGKNNSFFDDVKEEMKLVRWPNKKEILKYSIASLLFVVFFALFFFAIDLLFALIKGLI